MPEVFRVEGYVFFFYSNEGQEPIHIHVRRANGYAKFWLIPLTLDHSDGMKVQELSRAEALIEEHAEEIRRKWHDIIGN
jgi:hypothetical protein